MREFAVSVLVNLRDRLTGGLNGIRRRLDQLRNLGARLGLDRVGRALGGVIRQATLLGAAASAAFTALGGGALAAARSVANAGDAAMKAAARAGTSAERWQELAYAASLSDASTTGLERALGTLAQKAQEGDEMFRKLGISIRDSDGNVRDSSELFRDLASVFAAIPDGAEKSALAATVFGDRLGRELIPMLNEGREGLERLAAEAHAFGIIVPEELARASVEWNDNITRLGTVFTGLKQQIFGPLIPIFNDLTVALQQFILENKADVVEAMRDALLGAAEALPAMVRGVRDGIDAVRPFTEGLGALFEKMGGIETIGVALGALFSAKLVAALSAFGVALLATPIGQFILVVTGAVALIRKEWDTFEPYFEALLGSVKAVFEGDVSAILGVIGSLIAIVGQVIIEFGKWIAEVTGLDKAIAGAVEWLTGLGDRFKQVARDAARAIDEGLADAVAFMGELPARSGDAIVAGSGKLIEAGAALIQALWDGIKAKFAELLDYVREIPGRIRDAIGNLDPIGDIKRKLGSWWGGEDEAPPAKPPEGVEESSGWWGKLWGGGSGPASDAPALAGARDLASATPSTSSAGPRPERQEVGFTGELVVRVDGPGRVTSSRSNDPRVDIQPQRGPSLALP